MKKIYTFRIFLMVDLTKNLVLKDELADLEGNEGADDVHNGEKPSYFS